MISARARDGLTGLEYYYPIIEDQPDLQQQCCRVSIASVGPEAQ